jgi:hypothetical protein
MTLVGAFLMAFLNDRSESVCIEDNIILRLYSIIKIEASILIYFDHHKESQDSDETDLSVDLPPDEPPDIQSQVASVVQSHLSYRSYN